MKNFAKQNFLYIMFALLASSFVFSVYTWYKGDTFTSFFGKKDALQSHEVGAYGSGPAHK